MIDTDRESRIEELLLAIDTRLLMVVSTQREIESRLTQIQMDLRRVPQGAGLATGQASWTSQQSPEHMARAYAVVAALEHGPLTLTAIARAVYQREPEDRETQAVYRTLQRLVKDGTVTCDRKQYALNRESVGEEREEARA